MSRLHILDSGKSAGDDPNLARHRRIEERELERTNRFAAMDDEALVQCSECKHAVDEFTLIAERWRYWSDGCELLAFCPECARREFAPPDASASGLVALVQRREVSSSDG
jgi:hypothetical protein